MENPKNDFCIIIISHGRPDNVITYKTLKDAGCALPIFILIDNQDKRADDYLEKYRAITYIFDKEKYAAKTDQYDNLHNLRTTTHARNACFDLAKELGYTYFLVLDDDYGQFKTRLNDKLKHPKGKFKVLKNIDRIFLSTLEYFKSTEFLSICFSQGGDWFNGENEFGKRPKRKAMNSFFCSTERPFLFVSRLNEDVNTYMSIGKQGGVFMTIPFIQIDQIQTQANSGGMTEAYLNSGTYTKSFYTILCRPDCTKISIMGSRHLRLHHLIKWETAVPCIVEEKYRK